MLHFQMAHCQLSVDYFSIWKLVFGLEVKNYRKIPNTFFWLTFHGSLPTNEFRLFRHMSFVSSCNKCTRGNENIIHLLWDFHDSCQVWKNLQLGRDSNFYYNVHYFDQLVTNINSPSGTLFVATCQNLWKSRNPLIFQHKCCRIWHIINQVLILHVEMVKVLHQSTQPITIRLVNQKAPNIPFVKLNIDDNFVDNLGDFGFGGVIQNYFGNWTSDFSSDCSVFTNLDTKLCYFLWSSKGLGRWLQTHCL